MKPKKSKGVDKFFKDLVREGTIIKINANELKQLINQTKKETAKEIFKELDRIIAVSYTHLRAHET